MDEIHSKPLKALDVAGLVETHLQHPMDIGDCVFGVAYRCGGPPLQVGDQVFFLVVLLMETGFIVVS